MQALIAPKRPLRDIPTRQRRALAKSLAEYAARGSDRDHAMAKAYRTGADSLRAIAEHFDVSQIDCQSGGQAPRGRRCRCVTPLAFSCLRDHPVTLDEAGGDPPGRALTI